MAHQLELSDIGTILESFMYSKKNLDSSDSPYEIRKENLTRIEKVEAKLRILRAELESKS